MQSLILLIVCLFSIHKNQSDPKLDSVQIAIKNSDYSKADFYFKSIDTTALSSKDLALYYTSRANSSYNQDNYEQAYKDFLKAKSLFIIVEDQENVILTNRYLINIASSLHLESKYIDGYIDEICQYATKNNNSKLKCSCLHYKITRLDLKNPTKNNEALNHLWEYKKIALKNNLQEEIDIAIFNLGTVHMDALNKDSTLFYFDKATKIAVKKNDKEHISYLLNNYAILYRSLKEYDKSIKYHLESIDSELSKEELITKLFYLEQLAKTYSLKGDSKNASLTYEKALIFSDSLNRQEQALATNELETRFQTALKEKENLQLKADKEAQLAQIYGLTGGAIILFITGLFLYNNQRKKKLLAQKEQIIEKSRADTILKNQELATIDAMISGQEKERKRLAEELHDDLGSTLTTVRLYFENLKSQFTEENSQEVFNRTEKLIDEAYEKIRNMSHTRNSGILASKGLIPTLESLAHKITESGKIKVVIIHHGLDKSLENSLELTIFRILQELLNNIIKHAQASEAVISLTAYKDSINIMVEDNGIGFKKSKYNTKDGIGLHNIETRIESLDGTMEIDSQENRGTTINLDIPLI